MTVGKDAECILLMMAQEIGGIRAKEFSSHWKKIKPKTSVPLIKSISKIQYSLHFVVFYLTRFNFLSTAVVFSRIVDKSVGTFPLIFN